MPMPLWWGQFNKRIFNPRELKKGSRPVIRHIGRSSGKTFRTPLDAFPIEGGYVFALVYGSRSDWVKNLLAFGSAVLEVKGQETSLTNPRIVDRNEVKTLEPAAAEAAPSWLNVNEFLRMDAA